MIDLGDNVVVYVDHAENRLAMIAVGEDVTIDVDYE